jgi:RNA polymerase sigma-70 factor (ECF subfamily)
MDKQSYQKTFDNYFVPLCRYANVFLSNRPEAEDAVLDVFIHVWEHREEVDDSPSLRSYLFQSVHNRCLNLLRDRKRTYDLDNPQVSSILSTDHSPLELDELSTLVREAVLSLPPRCREVFVRSRVDNLSNQEIAEAMSISVKTVEAQITKSLKHLKKHLSNSYHHHTPP